MAFSYLMGIVPLVALGLGALFLGVIIMFLPESAALKASRLANLASVPSLLNIEALLEDLDVDTHGVYIPVSGFGMVPKVFVPLSESDVTLSPPLQLARSNRVFMTVGRNPRDRGILLTPPGGDIMSALENCLQLDFSTIKLEDLAARLDFALDVLGIARGTKVEYAESTTKAQMDLISLVEMEGRLRKVAPRLVAQVGTPLTSAVAAAVSKATGKYVRLQSQNQEGSRITLSLKLSEVGSQ